MPWIVSKPFNASLARSETAVPASMELQKRIVDVGRYGARKHSAGLEQLARLPVLLVLARAVVGLGATVDWPWSGAVAARFALIGSITVSYGHRQLDQHASPVRHGARHRTLVDDAICLSEDIAVGAGSRRIADAGRPAIASRNLGGPWIAPPWCMWWSSCRCWPFPAVSAALPTDSRSRLAPRSLLHPQPHLPLPGCQAGCSARLENRLAEPGCSAPNAGWTLRPLVTPRPWNAAFGAPAWCCSDYSAGLGAAGWAWPAANRLNSPKKTKARCAASWCSPVVASLRSTSGWCRSGRSQFLWKRGERVSGRRGEGEQESGRWWAPPTPGRRKKKLEGCAKKDQRDAPRRP